jgi:hypothetical protein
MGIQGVGVKTTGKRRRRLEGSHGTGCLCVIIWVGRCGGWEGKMRRERRKVRQRRAMGRLLGGGWSVRSELAWWTRAVCTAGRLLGT